MRKKKGWILSLLGIMLLCTIGLTWALRKEPKVDMNEIVTVYCLSEVRQSRNGEEMWTQHEYEYDECGNIICSTRYYASFVGYDPDVIQYEYDDRGNMTRCNDFYSDTFYTYDENDRILTEEERSHNGLTTRCYTYRYDEAGRLTYQNETRNSWGEVTVYETINTYDEKGNLVKKETNFSGEPGRIEISTYDEKNQLIKKESFYQGTLCETVTYTYDRAGRLLHYKEELYNTPERATEIYRMYDFRGNEISYKRYIGGKLVDDETNTYNLFGRLTSTKEMRGTSLSYQATYTYDLFGRLIRKVTMEPPQITIDYTPAKYKVVYNYKYDLWGNKVEQVMEHEQIGTEISTWKYDQYGNQLVAEHGDFRIERTYDQTGKLTRKYVRMSEDSEYLYEYIYITVQVPRWMAENIWEKQDEMMFSYE